MEKKNNLFWILLLSEHEHTHARLHTHTHARRRKEVVDFLGTPLALNNKFPEYVGF